MMKIYLIKTVHCLTLVIYCCMLSGLEVKGQVTNAPDAQKVLVPAYQRTSYANELVQLKNSVIKFSMFKRIDGWGWGEIYNASGKLIAVMDHLGEVMLRDQDIPMRLATDSFQRVTNAEGESLIFKVNAFDRR